MDLRLAEMARRACSKPPLTERKDAPLTGTFDKKDLIILKELIKDGRTKLSQLARLLDMTVPAVKYRFDNLARTGFIHEYVIDMLPFAPEISDLYEMILDFKTREGLYHGERVLATPFQLSEPYPGWKVPIPLL